MRPSPELPGILTVHDIYKRHNIGFRLWPFADTANALSLFRFWSIPVISAVFGAHRICIV
jgi:hypothetical protein